MEIQFWETLAPDELSQRVTLTGIYARLLRRLVQRSTYGVPPERMPTRFANVQVERERRGRFGKIKFAAGNMMGTAVSGSAEVYRVRNHRGFCEFGITGATTLQISTMIFKALIPDWQMIIDSKASRDVFNVMELSTLTQWEPEQDFSHNTTELKPPQRWYQRARSYTKGTWINRQ
jgi:hypothetical protein